MPARETFLVYLLHYPHQFIRWAGPVDNGFYQQCDQSRNWGQQDKQCFLFVFKHKEDSRSSNNNDNRPREKSKPADEFHGVIQQGILMLLHFFGKFTVEDG